MTYQIVPFNFQGNDIRALMIDQDAWFVGKDVAELLGYKNPREAIRTHCKAAKPVGGSESLPLDPQTVLIPERDVYRLVMRSKKPEAEAFEEWVVGDVLPSIRKTGGYESRQPVTIPTRLEQAKAIVTLLEENERVTQERDIAVATKAEIGSRREATAMNTASVASRRASKLEQELDKSKEYFTVKRMSMLTHGQQYSWRLLKSASQDVGIPPVDVFDANYGTVKAYHATAWAEAYGLEVGK